METSILDFKIFKVKSKVQKAIAGDKKAFCSLIRENKLSLYRVAKGMLKNEADIEDAISNCILKSYKNISSLKKEEFFKTWIIKILINECNNILKKSKKVDYINDYNIVSDSVNNNVYIDDYKNLDLSNAIYSLDKNLREVVILFYYEDMKQSDIAKLLQINDATVRTRLFRAKEKLKEILGNDFREGL